MRNKELLCLRDGSVGILLLFGTPLDLARMLSKEQTGTTRVKELELYPGSSKGPAGRLAGSEQGGKPLFEQRICRLQERLKTTLTILFQNLLGGSHYLVFQIHFRVYLVNSEPTVSLQLGFYLSYIIFVSYLGIQSHPFNGGPSHPEMRWLCLPFLT